MQLMGRTQESPVYPLCQSLSAESGGRLLKNDDRYNISFDAGLMFWGGTPDIITHDGTNLSKDVINIGGKVGDYVDLIKGVKAFPVLNLRITRRLF